MSKEDTTHAMGTPSQEQALTETEGEEQFRRGGTRWVLTGFSSEAFHTIAHALCTEAEKQGILLGAVYDVPEQAGVLFVREKQEGFPQ